MGRNVTRFSTDCTDRACDIVGVLDALGIEQAHIVGSSIGAEVGLSLAANYPERIRSLVAESAFHSEYGPYGTRDAESLDHDEALKLRLNERKATPEKTYNSREARVKEKSSFYKDNGLWNATMEAVLVYGIAETGRMASSPMHGVSTPTMRTQRPISPIDLRTTTHGSTAR